ncbi:hypothetical protein [Shewanella psychromarinicola]|uniref:Uncharacterized protein n=1 Tax=Shewanella psychromarinicola TaxID=2487742 RepID=A0A3N4DTV7_9GAMM|nr:hypothetical protein [Shewanella psychromarinicola]AZG34592.1 hypothetical protein EGC80_06415 [Shewanella psychromarinicola]MCL1084377.1 hypothetical protein [Shewanella psychromarinicola]RPA28167.1 hypothetical protein EGC77_15745 [Shewanella psychromarinicola]
MDAFLVGGFGGFITLFLFVLAILWFILPFAIFGTKNKLDELIEQTRQTNTLLTALRGEVSLLTDDDGVLKASKNK